MLGVTNLWLTTRAEFADITVLCEVNSFGCVLDICCYDASPQPWTILGVNCALYMSTSAKTSMLYPVAKGSLPDVALLTSTA